MTYATDWRWTPVPRDGVLRSTHHLITARRASDDFPITLAEVEGDRDENLDCRMSDAEQAEIARLIAAAPDMLAALKALSETYEAIWVKMLDGEMALCREAWAKADAAIAKAEGRS